MRVTGRSSATYLFINGLSISRPLRLSGTTELLPATCSPDPQDILAVSKTELDISVAAIFLRRVTSQLLIKAGDPKDLAVAAWNAMWDVVLLGAFAHCEAVCNLQCDTPAEDFGAGSTLEVTNYQLRGLHEPHRLTDEEMSWIEEQFHNARALLDNAPFQAAVHALSSYRWHTMNRARLAVLWSGIEGLFGVDSEVVFRVSLYISRYLYPDDDAQRAATFALVRRLYKQRSAAVHGSKVRGDSAAAVEESAELLRSLLFQCVRSKALPEPASLAP